MSHRKQKHREIFFVIQSEGQALHAPGHILTVCRNEGTTTMIQDGRRWKGQKLSNKNWFLGENSGMNYSQNQLPFHLKVNKLVHSKKTPGI